MPKQKTHDLYNFMQQISAEMATEYDRIQRRATEDPGTAGDQGEENWAELLRDWLPREYEVVTKGRIISQEGITSPQIDVLVLKDIYPKKLLNRKYYLAAGVAAAFECKTTLKALHIKKVIENCVAIKSLYPQRTGTPYKELHSPIVYGLLAHSHDWKKPKSKPEKNIEGKLIEADKLFVTHPRQQLDLLCVADLATWAALKIPCIGYGSTAEASCSYLGYTRMDERQVEQFTPIGSLILSISRKLAWDNPSLRELADYYQVTDIAGSGRGKPRQWSSSIYSDEIRKFVETGQLNDKPWDEWRVAFL